MAKLFKRKTAAVLTAALLLAVPFQPAAATAKTSDPLSELLNPSHSVLSAAKPGTASAMATASSKETGVIAAGIDTSSSKQVHVIVQLSGQPVTEAQYAAKLSRSASSFSVQSAEQAVNKEQSSLLSAASSKGISLKVNYRYNTVLNGMEITLPANQIPKLAALAGVKAISPNRTYYPIPLPAEPGDGTDATVTGAAYSADAGMGGSAASFDINPIAQIGADTAWAKNLTGKGLKIGVIDTGVDYKHPDLMGAYKGGYDSFYQDDDPYEEQPDFEYEGTYHGTHVSGTIVGRAANTSSDVVQKGVAYEADLYAYKVLGKTLIKENNTDVYKTSGTSAQVIDGVEHAVKDHMDVINMSLGSDGEKDPNSPDSIAVNNAVLAGVVAVVANGNAAEEGNYYYSMGSPASAQLAISVGAVTSDSQHYSGGFSTSVTDSVYNLDAMAWETSHSNFEELLGTEPLEAVYVGLGNYDDYYAAGDVHDKVVLISRGNLAFVDKISIAKEQGAKAAIIFNGDAMSKTSTEANLIEHLDGRDGPIGSAAFLGENYEYLPTFDMAGYEGRALARTIKASQELGTGEPLTFTFNPHFEESLVAGDKMADFSSRGPNSDGNYGIKPDISAPGVNIFSTWPAYGKLVKHADYSKAYERISGTSMATPHVAGLALLMKQEHPNWSPRDIRAALANTSDSISDETDTPYDVYSQGAGRANVANALLTPAILEAMDEITIYDETLSSKTIASEASSLSFGTLEPGSEPVSKPLRLKNTSGSAVTYSASVVMHPNVTSDPYQPTATPDVQNVTAVLQGLNGGKLNVAAGSTAAFSLSAGVNAKAAKGVYEGEVLLQSPGLPSLHLPFVLHVGEDAADINGLKNLSLTSVQIKPDAPVSLSATLDRDDYNFIAVELSDLNEQYVGRIAEWNNIDPYTQDLQNLPAGEFTLQNLDGGYINGDTDPAGNYIAYQLPEGQYKLTVYAVKYDSSYEIADLASAGKTIYMQYSDSVYVPEDPGTGNEGNGGSGGTGGGSSAPAAPAETTAPAGSSEVLNANVKPGQTVSPINGTMNEQNGRTVITVSDADLEKALSAAGTNPAVFSVSAASADSGSARLLLTASQVKLLKTASSGSSAAFTWNDASTSLPVSIITNLPAGADLAVDIAAAKDSTSVFTKAHPEALVLGTPYTFAAFAVLNGTETPVVPAASQPVSRAFLLDTGINAQGAGALYAEGSAVHAAPAQFSKTSDGRTLVKIVRPGFSTYAAASRHIAFSDISHSWASSEIQALADQFVLNGTSSSAFSPKKSVTRAEFAAMLVNALGLNKTSASASSFSDVQGSEWFAADVAAAYQAGLITGSEGKFSPKAQITRQDLTVMLARALNLLQVKAGHPAGAGTAYADASSFGAYAKESIQAVTDAGLMQGTEQSGRFYFNPAAPTTREAAAKVLYQLLQAAGLN